MGNKKRKELQEIILIQEHLKIKKNPFPPVEIQQMIAQKRDVLSVETEKLEALYQQKIDNLEELK